MNLLKGLILGLTLSLLPMEGNSSKNTSFILVSDRSSQWPKVRKQYIVKHPRCEACDSPKSLQVHHIIPVHTNPDKELDPTNLITLCSRCHLRIGHGGSFKTYNPFVREDATLALASGDRKSSEERARKNRLPNKPLEGKSRTPS